MARLFDDSLSEYLEIDQAVLSGTPLAMVTWLNSNDLTGGQDLLGIFDKDVSNNWHGLIIDTTDEIHAVTISSAGGISAQTTATVSVNTWYHGCGIWANSTDRRAFIDGGSKGTNATNRTPVSLDRTSIGRRGTSSPIKYMSGMIAEAAIWDLSNWPGATSGDKADNFEKILPSLVKGCSPLFFPLGLKAYWPLIRSLNDIVGGFNLTDINGTIAADHPTIIYPSSVPAGIFVAGEAPPAGIPIFRRRRECA